MTHTATPWVADGTYILTANDERRFIGRMSRPSSKDTFTEAFANAAFIIRAVNSHDELVAALDGLLKHTRRDGWVGHDIDEAEAALAKARGEP